MSVKRYRPDIQGLRAIAVLGVIAFHLNPAWLPGGFFGVDMFFAISGFLICSILLHKKTKPEYQFLTTFYYFYVGRIKRIAPAYYLILIAITLIGAILFIPADFVIYKGGLKEALLFNSNNYFANFGDYFAPANYEQPLLHTWSLAIEIQYYLIAPFLFLLLSKRLLHWLIPLSILCLTIYTECCLHLLGGERTNYYSLSARLPEFLLGAWGALLIGESKCQKENRRGLCLTFFAIGLITFAFLLPRAIGYFSGVAGLIPTIGVALIVFLRSNNLITRFLSCRYMVWIGSISYSLYLVHWPVLAFIRYYTGSKILSWQYSVVFIAITLFLSVVSYYLVESPLRSKTAEGGLLAVFLILICALLLYKSSGSINQKFSPSSLAYKYTHYGNDLLNCHGHIVGDCMRGDLSSSKKILVLGDSHAAELNNFFDYLGKSLGFKAKIITASSCITIPSFDYKRIPEWAQLPCQNQIKYAQQSKIIDSYKTIFLAASWNWQLESNITALSLQHFLKKMSEDRKKVFIILQEPLLNASPLRAYRFNYLGMPAEIKINDDYLRTNRELVLMQRKYSGVATLNLSDIKLFRTPPIYKNELIYLDEHHLNEVGVLEYAKENFEFFKDRLVKVF